MKLSSNKSKVNLSTKRGINLINHEDQQKMLASAVIAIIAIAVVALAVAKFGVIDQLARVTEAENEYNQVHQTYEQVMGSVSRYKDVQSEYRQYSTEWLDKNEDGKYVSVGRTDVLNLIEKELMSNGTVNNILITDDTADVVMSGLDLKDISNLCMNLEKNDIVAFATLTQGETEEKDKGGEVLDEEDSENETVVEETVEDEKSGLTFSIKITLQNPNATYNGNSSSEEA